MRKVQGIALLCVRMLLLTVLAQEAAEGSGAGSEPEVVTDGLLAPLDPPFDDSPSTEPLPEPTPSGYVPLTASAVGRTAGFPAVSSDGQASYSIPFDLPPGLNGLGPRLSLEYRHDTGDGLLGPGWSLGGLSVVTRCPRTIAQDGVAGSVLLTSADRFCLDGRRLVVVNGRDYGSDGTEYRTEIESFARIRSHELAGSGPARFVVEFADGRVAEYGATPDSRIDWAGRRPTARAWAINRLRDRAGNVVDFRYVEEPLLGSFRVAGIAYNGNPSAGVSTTHELRFIYETRPALDVDLQYVAGGEVRQVMRLDHVDLMHGGSIVRRLDLEYESALSTAGRSRLAMIRECGRDATECLRPTLLKWQDGQPGFAGEATYAWALGGAASLAETKRWWLGDINGDGRDDVVWSGGVSATLRYRLGQPAGTLGPEVDTGIAAPLGAGVPLDYDGDGIRDALMIGSHGRWQVVRGSTAGLSAPLDTGIAANAVDYRGADLDGNGLSDLAYSEHVGTFGNGLVVRVRYNMPGQGFSQVPVTLYQQAFDAGYDWPEGGNFLGRAGRPIDLDADGREDLLMNEEYSIARISADQRQSEPFDSSFAGGIPADINGDGCTDFAYPHYQGRWRVRFSGCMVAGPFGAEVSGPSYGVVRYTALALDWNGDGRDDIVYSDDSSNWKVVRSTGDRLLAVLDSGVPHGGQTSAAVGDVGGDGLQDLVARAGTRLTVRAHDGPVPDLLVKVQDGHGLVARFGYAPLSTPGVHTRSKTAAYPQQSLQDSRPVVVSSSVSDGSGTGTEATTAYRYAGLKRDLQGRGDLGYATRIATPATADHLRVDDSYRQDFPYAGLLSRQVVRRRDGAALLDVSLGWSRLSLGSGTSARYFPYIASSTGKEYEPGGSSGTRPYRTTRATVGAIDSTSGTVTDRSVVVEEGSGGANPGARRTERLRVLSLSNDSTNWCLGRPQASLLTANHTLASGAEITREQSLSWDTVACRVSAIQVEPNSSTQRVTETLEYDRFGNVSRSTVAPAGLVARTTNVDWGATGRFPVTLTRPHSMVRSAAWDPASGNLVALTDENGLVTRFEYDTIDRLVAQVSADGRRSTWQRQDCPQACAERASYRMQQMEFDAQGMLYGERMVDVDAWDRAAVTATLMPGGSWSQEAVEFDSRGRVLRTQRPAWRGGPATGYWQYAYDVLGRRVESRLVSADGIPSRSMRFEHDGLSVTAIDALGRSTQHRQLAWGNPVEVLQPGGARLAYEFDAFGRVIRIKDEAGHTLSEMTYGVRGGKTVHKDADLGEWRFTRDALDQVVLQRDAKAQVTEFGYDLLGRPVRRTEKEGVTSWVWGTARGSRNVGRLVSASGPGYSESYAYDAASRLATRTIKADATYQYAYAWDSASRLSSLTYPTSAGGFRLRLGYEYEAGQLARIRNQSAQGALLWQLGAMDAAGNVLDETLGTSTRVLSGFNPLSGELEYRETLSGSGDPLQDVAYRWDSAGNLVERHDQLRNVLERFSYDEADRFVAATRNGIADISARYDPAGNLRWRSDLCTGTADCVVSDTAHRHAIASAGALRFGYDANGNMTSRNGAAVGWYSYNLPSSLVAGGNQSSFAYGPARNRWKQVATDSGINETTVYVGGLLDKVTRAGKTTWRHYVQAPTGTAAIHVRHSDGSSPGTHLVSHDHLGSTGVVVAAANGAVSFTAGYDAFGRRRSAGGTGGPSTSDWAAIRAITRDGFTGHEHLDNVGLVHMNGRVYDPAIGGFLSPDPVIQSPFDRQDLNRYAYGWNNPLVVVDPDGLEEVACLQGRRGRCQGVTVTGLRQWPAGVGTYVTLSSSSNGQAVSAAQRDPCGQDSSGGICARSAFREAGVERGGPDAISAPITSAGDYLLGLAAGVANIGMNSVPVFWLFDTESDYEWFTVPASAAGRRGAGLSDIGLLVGGFGGAIRKTASGATRRIMASTGGVVRRFEVPDDRIFYRAYSGDANVGAWLTSTRPKSQAWAQEALALPPWNTATHVQEVLVPRGTLVERSRASQVPDWGRFRGGAEQFKLLETIPDTNFGSGRPLP